MTAASGMYAPTVLERIVALEPITHDDFIDEPSHDDRRGTISPVARTPALAHQRDSARSRRAAA